jgi:hypothetical protein
MADAAFDTDGVSLRLSKEEWWFLSSAVGHVLYGDRLADHDFCNILMVMPRDAERLFEQLSDAEVAARIAGNHWAPRPGARSEWREGDRTHMPQVGGAGSRDSPTTEGGDLRVGGRNAAQLCRQFESAFNSGADDEQRRVLLMRAIAGAIWSDGRVPEQLAPTMRAVTSAWASDDVPARSFLLEAKAAIWAELEARNGDSTTIADVVDRTLRACLCLTEFIDPAEAMDHAGWAAEMLSSEPWPRPPGSAVPRFF